MMCGESSLPGTMIYPVLLQRKCRVAVYLKRGNANAGRLRSPAFHVFGHPSDLEFVLATLARRRPGASIHVITYSAGNGLGVSHGIIHGGETLAVKSYLLNFGGGDMNDVLGSVRGPKSISTDLSYDTYL